MSCETFAAHLLSVRNDVRARGELRRGAPMADRHVLPHLDEGSNADVFYLVGALFAQFPGTLRGGTSLGLAYRKILDAAKTPNERKMYDNRVSGLCAVRQVDEAMHSPLRHAVALCAKHGHPLDWASLLRDLTEWEATDHHVQRRIAAEVWG